MMMYGVKKKSSDSQPYRAVHLGSVFIWGVTSSMPRAEVSPRLFTPVLCMASIHTSNFL